MPDVRWDWIERNLDLILRLTGEHIVLVVVSMAIAIAIALPVAIFVRRRAFWRAVAIYTTSVAYTVPSLALFAFLVPIMGIGREPVIVGLVAFALLILISNAVVGLQSVPAAVSDAARGMGLTERQRLLRVELPLAIPAIMAGVRLATVSTVGIATIGAFVAGGGLGELIYQQGIQRGLFLTPILVGTIMATLLAVVLDAFLVAIEWLLKPWERRAGVVGSAERLAAGREPRSAGF